MVHRTVASREKSEVLVASEGNRAHTKEIYRSIGWKQCSRFLSISSRVDPWIHQYLLIIVSGIIPSVTGSVENGKASSIL